MPDYDLAIKKPFTSFKKLIIGVLLSIIPIVNWISLGYILECSGLGKNKTQNLPEWANWKDLFVKGFLATIIQIIYYIPALLILLIFGAVALIGLIKTLIGTDILKAISAGSVESLQPIIQKNLPALMPYILTLLPILIIAAILGILASYIAPMAILNYLKNNRFGAAFEKIVFKKAFTGKYFIVLIIVGLLFLIVGSILGYVPILGGAITFFVMGIFRYTLLGQVYLELESKEILKKKKEKIKS